MMPKMTTPLTAKEVAAAKGKDKPYKLYDGQGLFLLVRSNTKRYWRLKYRMAGKEKTLAIGIYPETTLQLAREKRQEFRRMIAKGMDPSVERKKVKEKIIEEEKKKKHTFSFVSKSYFNYIPTLSDQIDPNYLIKQSRRIENHVIPYIGKMYIGDITREDIIEILERLKSEDKHETGRRILSLVRNIFEYAVDNSWLKYNLTSSIKSIKIIGKKTIKHYPLITDEKKLAILFAQIDEYTGHYSVKQALRIMPYVALRVGNIRFAEWSEIDFSKKIWRIPAYKMKSEVKNTVKYNTRDDHIIALSGTVLKILEDTHRFASESKYIFESPIHKGKPLSENTINQAIRRLGYTKEELVSHSFRAIFSTLTHENLDLHKQDPLIIEMQLAHKERNEVKASYNHAQYLPQRKKLMIWWSDYLDGLR
jgi:integrase